MTQSSMSPTDVRDLARAMAVPQMLRVVLALLEGDASFDAAELRLCHSLTTSIATWFGAKVTASTCPSCESREPAERGRAGLCVDAWHDAHRHAFDGRSVDGREDPDFDCWTCGMKREHPNHT